MVTFTEEILNEKLHFCAVFILINIKTIKIKKKQGPTNNVIEKRRWSELAFINELKGKFNED